MKNLLRIALASFLMLTLSGCFDEESRKVEMNVIMNLFVVLAYLVPILIALFYQFKAKNSKWYISILIAILLHIVLVGLTLFLTQLSFSEIVKILY
jgi:hypothetical protein